MNNKFIYFPSMSTGGMRQWLKLNETINPLDPTNKIPIRYYSDDMPEEGRYKFYLTTAGHNYKEKNFRKDWGLENSLVMGDSGGYQIATGALKWSDTLRDEIFEWLETNSDIAMNLDIPPRLNYLGRFNESLEISLNNFKIFEKKQSGKTDFLNVLQGSSSNEAEYVAWYNAVKGFDFQGWAPSNCRDIKRMAFTMALLLENGELANSKNKWIHYLGITGIDHLLMLTIMQKFVNKKYTHKITLTTDSSSPSRATNYGTYYFGFNWDKLTWKSLYFPKDGSVTYDNTASLPCLLDCIACRNHTVGIDIAPWDRRSVKITTLHNLYVFLDAIKKIDAVIESDDQAIKEVLNADWWQIYCSIKEMFESSHPLQIYEKYKTVYMRVSAGDKDISDKESIKTFFEF